MDWNNDGTAVFQSSDHLMVEDRSLPFWISVHAPGAEWIEFYLPDPADQKGDNHQRRRGKRNVRKRRPSFTIVHLRACGLTIFREVTTPEIHAPIWIQKDELQDEQIEKQNVLKQENAQVLVPSRAFCSVRTADKSLPSL